MSFLARRDSYEAERGDEARGEKLVACENYWAISTEEKDQSHMQLQALLILGIH